MSAAGDSGGDKTVEELLAALLTEREWLMVLEYSKPNTLECDSSTRGGLEAGAAQLNAVPAPPGVGDEFVWRVA